MQYVVLHHTGFGDEHFDLLIDVGDNAPLSSWRLSEWPPTDRVRISANTVHRRFYLGYEGAVSGGRGNVKRVAAGECIVQSAATVETHVILQPQGLHVSLPAKFV